mgnify:CR=1 FL=1
MISYKNCRIFDTLIKRLIVVEQDFILTSYNNSIDSGKVKWSSPSNIALVKYWGKYGAQLPKNTSLSFTLSHCRTVTQLTYTKKETAGFSFDIFLEGLQKEAFKPKIQTFFERIETYVPFLNKYHFKIETSNTFPHSSGIASSASGMSALALCIMSIERSLNPEMSHDYFYQKASFLARLGSGSACRSIQGPVMVWGEHEAMKQSSQFFGAPLSAALHPNFKNYNDAILIVDKGEKVVSSTVGHDLMHNHPFAEERFKQANKNFGQLLKVLKSGDLKAFIKIVEQEALSLHAMMLTSDPYFILMKPNTLQIINKIWQYRAAQKSNICFTLDAGANVHVLFPENETEKVYEFIKSELVAFCQNGHYICDTVGKGAQPLITQPTN